MTKGSRVKKKEIECCCCWEKRDQDQIIALSVSENICFSCIEVGIKFLNGEAKIRPANWVGPQHWYNVNKISIRDEVFTICENCLRALYEKIPNPKKQIQRHFDLKRSPLPLLPAMEVKKHYHKKGNKIELLKCEICNSEAANFDKSMALASGLHGPSITFFNRYSGDFIKDLKIPVALAGVAGIFYVAFLSIKWFVSTSIGQSISFGLGLVMFVLGLVIGAASAPMGHKDGTPGYPIQGTIGVIILIVGAILMGLFSG